MFLPDYRHESNGSNPTIGIAQAHHLESEILTMDGAQRSADPDESFGVRQLLGHPIDSEQSDGGSDAAQDVEDQRTLHASSFPAFAIVD